MRWGPPDPHQSSSLDYPLRDLNSPHGHVLSWSRCIIHNPPLPMMYPSEQYTCMTGMASELGVTVRCLKHGGWSCWRGVTALEYREDFRRSVRDGEFTRGGAFFFPSFATLFVVTVALQQTTVSLNSYLPLPVAASANGQKNAITVWPCSLPPSVKTYSPCSKSLGERGHNSRPNVFISERQHNRGCL